MNEVPVDSATEMAPNNTDESIQGIVENMADDAPEEEKAQPPKGFEFPQLRFEGGDCIIEISEDREEDIVAPSAILKQFQYFAPIIEGRWNEDTRRTVYDEENDKDVTIFTWGLRHDGTKSIKTHILVLESGVSTPRLLPLLH
jgi:hypothetical protein